MIIPVSMLHIQIVICVLFLNVFEGTHMHNSGGLDINKVANPPSFMSTSVEK